MASIPVVDHPGVHPSPETAEHVKSMRRMSSGMSPSITSLSSLRLPSPKAKKPVKQMDLIIYSSFQAGDVLMRSTFEPSDVERVELAALRKLGSKVTMVDEDQVSKISSSENEEDVEELQKEAEISHLMACSYPLFCCHVKPEHGAVFLYMAHLCVTVALLGSAIYFAEFQPSYQWAGVAYWCYATFFGVCLIAPLFADLVVALALMGIRQAIRYEEDLLNKELKRSMEVLFFLERMRTDSARLIYLVLDTASFVVLFQSNPGTQLWQNAYNYTSYVLGVLCVWAGGQVITSYITNSISRSVNVRTLGNKIRDLLFHELTIFRLSGAPPPPGDEKVYFLAQQKHLYEDPRTAAELAANIMRAQMQIDLPCELKKKRARVELASDSDGRLLGAYLFASMLQLAQKREAQTQKIMLAIGPKRKLPKNFAYLDLAIKLYTKREIALKLEHLAYVNPKRGIVPHYTRRFMLKSDVEVMMTRRKDELPLLPKVDVADAWKFFDPDQLGKISLKRARSACLDHVQARRNMRGTLKNAHEVVQKLRIVVSVVINFFVFLCALAIFQVNVLEVWVGISSIILGFSFVFGATLKSILDSLVFLFAVHAYDVGDKIKIGTNEDTYYVREINLMSTKMARWDGSVTKLQNYLLLNQAIINCRESEPAQTVINFWVDAQSVPPKSDLDAIQNELEIFLSRDRAAFTGACSITVRDITVPLQARIAVWFAFTYNDTDMGRLNRDKTRVILFLIQAFKRKHIKVSGTGMGIVDLEKGLRVGLQASGAGSALRVI